MRFKQFSGTAVVPFLARVVLALAFATVGYNKIFTSFTTSDPAQLQGLRDAGVSLTPPVDPADAADVPDAADPGAAADETSFWPAPGGRTIELAGFRQPAPGEDAPAAPASPAGEALPDTSGPGTTAPLPASAEVRSLHRITLMLHQAAYPAEGESARVPAFVGDYATWLAWVAALTEFLGGVMILFGMLTRVWGLGLSIAMVTAFWLTTVPVFAGVESTGITSQMLAFAEQIPDYNRAVAQLALFVLAFGLLLTGAGPLSVDAILFARDPHKDVARHGGTHDPATHPGMHPGVPPGGAAMTPGSVAAPMGAAYGTAYPPGPGQSAPPPGVQMPPAGGHGAPAPPPTDAWGTPVAPVPPPAAAPAPPPEIPLHEQPAATAPPVPPVAPRPHDPEALPSVSGPAGESEAEPAAEDGAADDERPRYQPGQSFGGEGRPL